MLIIWEDETKRKTWAPWFSLLNCVLHWISKAKHDLIRNMITTWQGRYYSPLQLQFKSISFWKSIYVMLVWFGLNLLHLQLLGSIISFKQKCHPFVIFFFFLNFPLLITNNNELNYFYFYFFQNDCSVRVSWMI